MKVYYFMFEAKPFKVNPESKDLGGAYICCWVNSENETSAFEEAKEYINNEEWEIVNLKEKFITNREHYEDNPESLDSFDQAVMNGISAIFYTWAINADDADVEY